MTIITLFVVGLLAVSLLTPNVNGAVWLETPADTVQQSVKPGTVTYKAVVVTASRFAQSVDSVGRTVHIITREQLKSMPVHSIAEAVSYIPGVDVQQRGPLGTQADVSMRGGGFEQTAILINGMRITDPQTAHNVLALPFLMSDIERIEVVKGGASRVHGPGAMDGVINIILREGSPTALSASFTAGEFKYLDGSLSATLHDDGTTHRLSGQIIRHGDYRHATDLDLKSIGYQMNTNIDEAGVHLFGSVIDKKFGAALFYTPSKYPNAWERTVTWIAGADVTAPLDSSCSMKVGAIYRANGDEFLLKREDPAFYHNQHTTHTATLNAALYKSSVLGNTTLAVEGGTDQIVSSSLGTHERNRIGGSIEHIAMLFPWLRATIGANLLAYSDRSPGIGWGADLAHVYDAGRIYGTVNRSFRTPSYTELYYKDPTTIGDPTLRAETAMTYEVGWAHNTSANAGGNLSLFRRNQTDGIDYAFQGDSLPFKATNIQSTIINGIEAGVWYKVSEDLPWTGMSLLRLGMNLNDAKFSSTVPTRYALRQLRWQGTVQTTFDLPGDITATFLARLFERYSDHVLRSTGDIKIGWTILEPKDGSPSLELMAEVLNVWNETYIETGFGTAPPRWFRVGISSTFIPL